MSGIAGIFNRDSKPVHLEQLEAMGSALAYRGPDGINFYCQESVGFVHCMLHDTPESLLEILPKKARDGNFIITFNGRIDNRLDLYSRIGWREPLPTISDSDLVLAAYHKWKQDCVYHLLGDFSFSIWDRVENQLFCARDQMGVKPFYYYCSEKIFAFSSEIKGIFALEGIKKIKNDQRIAEYLTRVVVDKESTFFYGINRLPPGSLLIVKQDRLKISRYHSFQPTSIYYRKDDEYEEHFREIFIDAVSVRLRSASPVGAFLSGGLDSSTIVCTAAGLLGHLIPGKLHVFSGVFDTIKECDERGFFLSVLERYRNLCSHTVLGDKIDPSLVYEKLLEVADEPFLLPHIFMSSELLSCANKTGVRVVLDGFDGDAAVSYGTNVQADLLLSWKVVELIHLYREAGLRNGNSILKRIVSLIWRIFQQLLPLGIFGSPKRGRLLKNLEILDKGFAKETRIASRLLSTARAFPYFGQKEADFHQKNISQPLHSFTLEALDWITARESIVARYPYFDRRVIEFCLALPVNQKFKGGLNRSIVRRAFRDCLPTNISLRKNKTNFYPNLLHSFFETGSLWLSQNVEQAINDGCFGVNIAYIRECLGQFPTCNAAQQALFLRHFLLLVTYRRWISRQFSG